MEDGYRLFLATVGLLAAVSLISLLMVAQIAGEFLQPRNDSFSHKIDYDVTVQVNDTAEDVELMLPYPEDRRFTEAIAENRLDAPEGWNLSRVQTSRGTMIMMEAGELVPYTDGEGRSQLGYQDTYDLQLSLDYNRSLNTSKGLTEEPHLPRENISTWDGCMSQRGCYTSTSEAYLKYDASNDTYIYIDVDLEGRNEWFAGGWTGNYYRQEFRTGIHERVVGPQDGWVELNGTEEEGVGTYRD